MASSGRRNVLKVMQDVATTLHAFVDAEQKGLAAEVNAPVIKSWGKRNLVLDRVGKGTVAKSADRDWWNGRAQKIADYNSATDLSEQKIDERDPNSALSILMISLNESTRAVDYKTAEDSKTLDSDIAAKRTLGQMLAAVALVASKSRHPYFDKLATVSVLGMLARKALKGRMLQMPDSMKRWEDTWDAFFQMSSAPSNPEARQLWNDFRDIFEKNRWSIMSGPKLTMNVAPTGVTGVAAAPTPPTITIDSTDQLRAASVRRTR